MTSSYQSYEHPIFAGSSAPVSDGHGFPPANGRSRLIRVAEQMGYLTDGLPNYGRQKEEIKQ